MPLTADNNHRHEILQAAIQNNGTPPPAWKLKLTEWCDKAGLLELRVVRKILNINCTALQDKIRVLAEGLQKTQPLEAKSLREQFNGLLEKQWKVLGHHIDEPPPPAADAVPLAAPPAREHRQWAHVVIRPGQPIPPEALRHLVGARMPPPPARTPPAPARFRPMPPLPPQFPPANASLVLRTVAMARNLGNFQEYDPSQRALTIGRTDYQAISHEVTDFTKKPLASCGSGGSREIILLDPANSPKLNEKYQVFGKAVDAYIAKKRLADPSFEFSAERLALMAEAFVRAKVFPSCIDQDVVAKTIDFVDQLRSDPSILKATNDTPCVPIDRFIEAGLGVCRHHSLATVYLLDRYMDEHQNALPFQGKVQVMRDNVPGGAHAWVTLIVKDKASGKREVISIDSLQHRVANLTVENSPRGLTDRSSLEKKYGQDAVRHQLEKAALVQIP